MRFSEDEFHPPVVFVGGGGMVTVWYCQVLGVFTVKVAAYVLAKLAPLRTPTDTTDPAVHAALNQNETVKGEANGVPSWKSLML
jgi:hypothetical protein